MTRVLHVLATLKRAGAERMVASLVSRLNRDRFQPAIATLFDASPGDLESEVAAPYTGWVNVPVWIFECLAGFDV